MTDLLSPKPRQPASVRIDRLPRSVEVYLDPGNIHIASRDEATGAVLWHRKLTDEDRAAVKKILAGLPSGLRLNRMQRRRAAVLARKRGG